MRGNVSGVSKLSAKMLGEFRSLGVSTVYEGMGRVGLMDAQMKPIGQGMKVAGSALTVLIPQGDNLMEHEALTHAKRGEVLVVAMEGPTGGTWGEIFTTQALHIGLAGVVTDGFVRDVEFVRKIGFPCFARGISSQGSSKKKLGSINISVNCGGVSITPGDLVLGDDDGVVVIPRNRIESALELAKERAQRERQIEDQIRRGKTTFELFGFQETYRRLSEGEVVG